MIKKIFNIILKFFLYFFFCFIGTILTVLVVIIDINVIIASSLISIIIAFFTVIINDQNHFSWATFCGSFAGMTSLDFLKYQVSLYSINFFLNLVLLAFITSTMYTLSEVISYKFPKISFDGYGGRLGTIAFISVIIYILLMKFIFNKHFNFFIYNKSIFNNSFDYFLFGGIIFSIIAALISMEIKNTVTSLNDNYKVITVATTGLIGGILITKIPQYGIELGAAWYTGAFVGMTSYYVLMLKRHFLLSGLISGIYFILSKNIFIGIGGKLGFISFLAVLTMKIIVNFYNFLIKKFEKPPEVIVNNLEKGEIFDQKVDDDYAEKLVESLLKVKDKVKLDITPNEIGNFVIGKKIDISDYENEKRKNIYYFEILSNIEQDFVKFINSLHIFKWCYLQKDNQEFNIFAYQGIEDETLYNTRYKVDTNFISVLEKEKRVIAFSKKGINQNIFINKISKKDLKDLSLIIIVPIFSYNILTGFFFIFDQNKDLSSAKINYDKIKEFYNNQLLLQCA